MSYFPADPPDELSHESALRIIVERHTSRQFGPDALASELFVSRRHLYRRLSQVGGVAEIIGVARAETAARLLVAQPHVGLHKVLRVAGFGNEESFRAHFRHTYGVPPRRYRPDLPSLVPDISLSLAKARVRI